MKAKFVVMMLALGLVSATSSAAAANGGSALRFDPAYAQADTGGTRPDTTMARPDSAATPAVTAPPPATPPPAPAPAPEAAPPATQATAAAASSAKAPNEKIYYGGTVTLSFGSSTQIGIFPMIGYKISPKVSVGAEVGYEYVDFDYGSTHNYGGSVFGRFRVGRNLYAHGEYQAINYEIFSGPNQSKREWVPALLLGGGALKPISPTTAVYAEVLFDVLRDQNSPYGDFEPIVSFGVTVGF